MTDPSEIAPRHPEAFYIASDGRPGPVLVDIAKSAMQATTTFYVARSSSTCAAINPVSKPHAKTIQEAARLLATARRPVLYVGGGVIRSGASEGLRKLVDLSGAAVVTTLMARGALPDSHPQHLGMPGMHGTVPAVAALQKADLVVALGARFDDRVTGKLDRFAPHAQVVHADIDPAEIGKNRARGRADRRGPQGRVRRAGARACGRAQAARQAGHRGVVDADQRVARDVPAGLRAHRGRPQSRPST